MLFNSVDYLFFLPFVFGVYWLLKNKLQIQNTFLLICSYFFYGLWDFRFLTLIAFSSLVDYLVGISLSKSASQSRKKILLTISIVLNIGLLMAFKYFNFFIESFVDLANEIGFQANYSTLNIILPVGISFYTFQTLSYTIDIYRGTFKPTRNIINFFTYVAFFPQLVAGPIERASRLLPQIEKKRTFSLDQAKSGMRQILWGLFKKVVVADNCALIVDGIFANYESLDGLTLILGTILFAFQVYCDFSGYSDIAIGTAKLLGIKLMQNFATPYFSRSIGEFWRRWHISLTTWFRDYLYIPLGGNRGSKYFQARNVFIVFLVSGLWHGASWTFFIWGLVHALIFMPAILTNRKDKFLDDIAIDRAFPSDKDLFQIVKTFVFLSVTFVIFRAPSIWVAYDYVIHWFSFEGSFIDDFSNIIKGVNLFDLLFVLIFISILLIFEWTNRTREHGLVKLPGSIIIRYSIYIVLSLLVIQFLNGEANFIYFQF